ncbi:MAG: RNA methyltransferase [Pyrinomonadaceae bacterium]|nr:RNA methyltransferase [Pyrinomonadaceae bacterium]
MSYALITSRHNALAKHARSVRDRRDGQEQIFIEGLRLAEEAVRSRLVVQDALFTEKFQSAERGAKLLSELKSSGARLSLMSEDVLASVSDTRTPQGIVLLASRPRVNRESLFVGANPPLLVIIHSLNNPSNAGAIIRTAEAAGATGIISTRGTTDLFSAKALRGAMGSSFRLPLCAGLEFTEALNLCAGHNVRTIGAALSAAKYHTDADWTGSCALVLGSEAAGLTESEVSMLDEAVRIPMRPPVESLNAAVASGIILYEAARQRTGVRG